MSLTDTADRAERVVSLPISIKPNIAKCFEFIDKVEGEGGYLLQLAQIGIGAAESNRSKIIAGTDPGRHLQPMIDGFGLAFFALGTLLGIPRGELDEVDLDGTPTPPRAMEPAEREAARARQTAPLKRGDESPVVETFHDGGKTRDKIGAFAGVSREPRFAAIKAALKQRNRVITRGRRRRAALIPDREIAPTFWAEPLHLLKAVFEHAEVIALDRKPDPETVHFLLSLPTKILDRCMEIGAMGEDDEETGDDEPSGNSDKSADEEASIAVPDGLVNQLHPGYSVNSGGDLEADPCDLGEPDSDFEPGEDDEPEHEL